MHIRITVAIRSFLDYRIPLFAELNELCDGQLHVVFPDGQTPQRCRDALRSALGTGAIELRGERTLGRNRPSRDFANSSVCIPYQPGLLRTVRETKPDVIVGEGFFQWTPALVWYRLRRRVPLALFYERTFHTERNAQSVRSFYRKAIARCVDAVCCNGRLSKEYTNSLGVGENRITTGFASSDASQLSFAVEQVSVEQRKRFREELEIRGTTYLFIGQLVRRKGVYELLQAWSNFTSKVTGEKTLVVAGDGAEQEALEATAKSLNLKNVCFLGHVDHADVHMLYATANCFVMPTLEDNWSMVVPEAMACRLPVLTSEYNGCWPELVQEGDNGFVFDPLDETDFCATLIKANEHQTRFQAMGERSYSIIQNHTPKHSAEAVYQACEIAMSRRSKL